jgi:hypothetical protein
MTTDYTILLVGDYFSTVINVNTTKTNPDDIAFEAFTFAKDYYGWGNLEEVTKQITVRNCDTNEEWDV